jgi:SAM-dependent methyltransferase
MKASQDAFGKEIYAWFQGKDVTEIVERDDGSIGTSNGPCLYFLEYPDWPPHQQEAMGFVQGRVLDIGSGAGRVSLYLQSQGHEVLAMDNSPLALEVCRKRGVQHTLLASITQLERPLGVFDTIVMLGNNFGLFGNPPRAKWLLRHFNRLTSPGARIIAESNNIYLTDNPVHLAYHDRNRKRGRLPGQIRLRIRYEDCKGEWFDYLMVSPIEMERILEGTPWQITKLLQNPGGPSYVAVFEKRA